MATTIRIAETTRPSHTNNAGDDTDSNPAVVEDGIYNMRGFTRTATGSSANDRDGIYNMRAITRTFSRSSSKDKRGFKGGDKEAEDDDPGLRQSGDFKSKQVCGMHSTAYNGAQDLTLSTLGLPRQNIAVARLSVNRCHLW